MEYPYELVDRSRNEMRTAKNREKIIKEFAETINRHSLENDSNTPDFILAEYLWECLMVEHLLICKRTIWYNSNKIG